MKNTETFLVGFSALWILIMGTGLFVSYGEELLVLIIKVLFILSPGLIAYYWREGLFKEKDKKSIPTTLLKLLIIFALSGAVFSIGDTKAFLSGLPVTEECLSTHRTP